MAAAERQNSAVAAAAAAVAAAQDSLLRNFAIWFSGPDPPAPISQALYGDKAP